MMYRPVRLLMRTGTLIHIHLFTAISPRVKRSVNTTSQCTYVIIIQTLRVTVFLGGSCGGRTSPTTWREDKAIPFLQEHDITFFNPVSTKSLAPELESFATTVGDRPF